MYRKQWLAVLDRLPVFNEDAHDFARYIGLDFIHQFHRFDDAQNLACRDVVAYAHENVRSGTWRRIKSTYDRRFDNVKIGAGFRRGRLRRRSGRGIRGRRWRCGEYLRSGLLRSKGKIAMAGRFAQPNMHRAVLIFKFLQRMLLHESKNFGNR